MIDDWLQHGRLHHCDEAIPVKVSGTPAEATEHLTYMTPVALTTEFLLAVGGTR